jgi:hypothetical protein
MRGTSIWAVRLAVAPSSLMRSSEAFGIPARITFGASTPYSAARSEKDFIIWTISVAVSA